MGKVKIENKKVGLLDRVLNSVERVGNKLPDHVTIFFILCGVIFVLSAIISSQDVSAIHPSTGEKIIAINLLTKEQLKIFLGSIVSNFQSFAPLGLVLVTMIGAGIAEKTGLMEVLMKQTINKLPKK